MKVLLVASERWISTARLAMALIESGCEVSALCRSGHPLLLIKGLHSHLPYSDSAPSASLKQAIRVAGPELLICCDEETFRLAHLAYSEAASTKDKAVKDLLERSFGDPKHYHVALSRFGLMKLASTEGIAVPESLQIDSPAELQVAAERLCWPLVLKSDGSFGGNGVRIADDAKEAITLWRRLRGPVDPLRTLNRVLLNKRLTPLYEMIRRQRSTVLAQRRVIGPEATLAASCWRGEMLACTCMEVVESWNLRGPSSVLRVIESEPMLAAARRLIRLLGLSGLCGFDFVLEAGTGIPYLIEMNVRPTQTVHLALGPGKDLVSALVRAGDRDLHADQVGAALPEWRVPVITQDYILLFPQEIQRDPESKWLSVGFHDLPSTEPSLVDAAMSKPAEDWYGKLRRRVMNALKVRL